MRHRLGLFWLLLSSAVSAGPIERLTLTASPISSFAPTNLVVLVHVTPDRANRALEVIADNRPLGVSVGVIRVMWMPAKSYASRMA